MNMKKVNNQDWFGQPSVYCKVYQPLPQDSVLNFINSQESNLSEQIQENRAQQIYANTFLNYLPSAQQQCQEQFYYEQKGSFQQDISSRSQKNICTYIERTIIKSLLSRSYRNIIQQICLRYNCQYSLAISYFRQNSKQSFGISHLIGMMTPIKQKDKSFKKVFTAFLKYFLRNKYSIHMLKFGKMQNKNLYLKVKNRLLYLSETIPKQQIPNPNCDNQFQTDIRQPQH